MKALFAVAANKKLLDAKEIVTLLASLNGAGGLSVASPEYDLYFERKGDAKKVRDTLRSLGQKEVHVSRGPEHFLGASGTTSQRQSRRRRSTQKGG